MFVESAQDPLERLKLLLVRLTLSDNLWWLLHQLINSLGIHSGNGLRFEDCRETFHEAILNCQDGDVVDEGLDRNLPCVSNGHL